MPRLSISLHPRSRVLVLSTHARALTAAAALLSSSLCSAQVMAVPDRPPVVAKAERGCISNPVVANIADAGAGSLRQAIADACSGSTITFNPAFFDINIPRTITLTSGELNPQVNMTINGYGPVLLTVSGNDASRVFGSTGIVLTLSGMTLTRGNSVSNNGIASGFGGALASTGGAITLNDMRITASTCVQTGSVAVGGGTLALLRTTISGNTCGNVSGIFLQDGSANLIDSTLSNNSGSEAIRLDAFNANSSLTLVNATLSGNTATSANSAIRLQPQAGFSTSLMVTNSTISGNSTSGAGNGAIWVNGTGTHSILLRNSIVSGNTVNGAANDIEGVVNATSAFNLIGTGGGLVSGVNGNQVGINNPLLAPLGQYGGSTATRTPLPGSPAINAGSNALATGFDQRGYTRPRLGTVDIGAAESWGFELTAISGSPQSTTVNTAFAASLVVNVSADLPNEPVNGGRVTFSAPAAGASATFAANPVTITGGNASASPTANATAGGPYNVTATTSGDNGGRTFALTNLAACISNPVVANAADAGAGSLRQAIADACVGSTISFNPAFFGAARTITLTTGELLVPRDLTITGPGAGLLTVSGNNASRVIASGGTTLMLSAMTFSGGSSVGIVNGFGGAVLQSGGALTLNDMVITGSTCVFTGSVAVANGTLNLLRTSISGNTCNNVSGIYLQDSNAVLLDSTLSGNTGSSGDAIRIDAFAGNNTLTLNNVTISGNTTSTDNSAVRLQPQAGRTVSFTATNSTISGNTTSGPGKGAIWVNGVGTHMIVLRNSIVSGNTVNGVANDFEGTVDAASSFNLVGTGSGLVNGVNNNQVGITNPLLAPLGNYGGSTQTRTPLPGSPAFNAGSNALATGFDQRGIVRPQLGVVDIGAAESRGFAPSQQSGSPQTAALGSTFGAPLVVRVVANDGIEPVNGGQVTFTAPGSGASATLVSNPASISGGMASVIATANNTEGNYPVLASVSGVTLLPFLLTNGLQADLMLSLTDGSSTATPGGSVVYTLAVFNGGPLAVSGATVTDNFPASLSACSWTCVGANGGANGGSCGASGTGNIADSIVLQIAATVTYTASCTVSPGATGTLVNTASVANPPGVTDPNPANNSATDTDTLNPAMADLSITLVGSPDPVTAGDNLTYVATASNGGLADAQDVVISLPLPAGTSVVSATASGAGSCTTAGPVVCTWSGATAPASQRSATVVTQVSAGQVATLSATATVSSATGDPVSGNNSATASTTVIGLANLALTLTAAPTLVVIDQPVVFTAVSSNAGPGDAQDVQIGLLLSAGLRFAASSASAGGVCSAPAVGQSGPVSCVWAGATAAGVARTVAVTVSSGAAGSSLVQASTSSATTDPVSANNAANVTLTVRGIAIAIPALGSAPLYWLGLLVGGLGLVALRRRG